MTTPSRPCMGSLARSLTLALAVCSAAAPAQAQAPYPNKPVRVIVPFPAGGGGDTLARMVLTRVGTELGQTMVFENTAGAGGNVGTSAGSRAAADGYTLLYGTNGTLAINQTLYKQPGFDSRKDLQPVSRLTRIGLVVAVRPGLPAATMPELLKLLKSNPGKYTFGSAGNGTSSHLAGEILKSQAGLSVVHIPYRGGAMAMTDLIGGQIDLMIEVMPSAMPHVRSGRVRGLAVTTPQRVGSASDLPTLGESGLPGFEVAAWDAVTVPAGTPAPVIERLNAAIRKVLADPELIQQLAKAGAEPAPSSPAELATFIETERDRWGAAVKRSGAAVE